MTVTGAVKGKFHTNKAINKTTTADYIGDIYHMQLLLQTQQYTERFRV